MSSARHDVEAQVAENHGRLVNFVGDNFMAVFDHATDAVHAAIAISSTLEATNSSRPSAQWLRFRMGIDRGEITVSDGHFEGDALNIAARIQALARAGGLSISGSVYRELDEPALRFRPIGAQTLKNIPESIEVYEFVDLPTDSQAGVDSRLGLEIPSIAVLPVHVEGVDEAVASAATVIRVDAIHRLSMIPELVVVDAVDADAGQQRGTGVRYMLETGVNQFGDRLRVHATVFDVTTMNVVKAHKLTGSAVDMFELSETLSEQVGHTIEVELVVGAPAGLYSEIGDPVAIEKVYMGWFHLRSDTREGWQTALGLFGEVAESHPDLPFGWVLSAFANWIGAANGWSSDRAASLAMAREQAERGRTVGDPTGLAQAVEAAALMSMGHVDAAVEAVGRLEITRPTCDVTFGLEGSLKRYLGEWEEAVDLLDTAMRLTGINKPWYPTVKACSLFIGHKTEQAASVAESVLEYQPNNIEALLVLAAAQVELGLDRRAEATANIVRERFPSLDVEAWLDRNPYQDHELMDRWKADLASVDLVGTS